MPAVYENVDAWAQWVGERHTLFGLGTTKAAVLTAAEEAAFRTYTPAFDIGMATCEDGWPTDLEGYYADMRAARENYPYGYGVLRFQPQVSTFWTERKMEPPPEVKRDGFEPGIVVHGIGNTMLSHAGAEAMAKRLGFSLISVTDEGHSEIFAVRSNKEVDDYVYKYLIDGVLLPERVTCAGQSRPDIAPDSAGGTTGSGAGTLVAQIEEWDAANRLW